MSTKKFGIVAGIALMLSVAVSPAFAACSMTTLSECDNSGLMALIVQLLSGSSTTSTTTTTGTSISGIPAGFTFTTNLKQGSTGNDVKYLQILLNSDSATSIGNAGKETTYFGAMTKAAVVKFQNKYASETLTPYGLSAGTGFFGTSSRAKANALISTGTTTTTTTGGTTTTTPTTTGFTVSLAADTPAAGTLITGAAIADIAHFTFSNGTSSPVTITNLKMNRLGVSADATLSKLYLYDGNTRLSDEATASTGVFTWNNSTGVITIPANTVKVIAVKANIATSTSGQTVGVGIVAADSITGATATGTFPVNANIHTIAQATLAEVNFSSTTTPAENSTGLTPQSNFIMFENSVNVNTRAVYLKSITFRNIGSVAQSDLQNFKLMIDGVQVGSTIVSQGTDGYFTFDMSSSPIKLETGTRIFKVVGDVIGGSTRTFKISIYKASDVQVTDSEYNANILVLRNSVTFSPVEAGQQLVATGALSITKRTDSTSGNIAKGASQLTLAKYDLKATGEAIKIENLRVSFTSSDATVTQLRNAALFVDGVQVGSTATLNEDSHATLAYTEFSLGSSLVVTPGTTKVLEVRADIYDNDGTDHTSAGDTIKVNLVAGSTNAQRMTSGGYFSTTENLDANTLQIASGTLSSTLDQSYGSSSVVVPQTNFLLGKFSVTAGSTENINLNTVRVLFNFSASDFASEDITNVYVKYGTDSTSALSTITSAAAGAYSLNTFSISKTISKTQSITFEVYGDIASSAYSDATADTVQTYLQVSGTTAQSGTTVYSRGSAAMATNADNNGSAGQTITATGSGNLTVTLDNSTPLASQVVAGATPDSGSLKIKMTAANGDLYVKRVDLRVDTTTDTPTIASVDLYAAQGSGTYTKVGETQVLNYDGSTPGYVQWILGGDARVQILKSGTTYLLAKPTYVSSGQYADATGKTPQLVLVDLEVDGANGTTITPGFSGDTNATGIVIKSNNTGVYTDTTTTGTLADAADAVLTVSTDASPVFAVGDILRQGTEMMVVLSKSTLDLTVQRGAFGTTAAAHAAVAVYRLDNSGTIRGIIGNAQTVLNTKLALSLGSDSPSGSTTGATGKVVFTFNAAAENNATDPAENKAVLTRIDITTTESAATVSNLSLYPSEYDNNSTYATTCSGLTATKWRCVMNTTGGANEVIENTSRKYIARADVGYSGAGNIAVSINNLGTVDTGSDTNDVIWTDGTTAQDWVNQATTSVQGGSQTTTASSGTADTTAPTIASLVFGGTASNTLVDADTITITFSEIIDPTTINASLLPGGSAVTPSNGATGDVALDASGVVTITNIATTDVDGGASTATTYAPTMTLDATGKILTITLAGASATGALSADEVFGDVVGTTTTVKDVNAVTLADSTVNASGSI